MSDELKTDEQKKEEHKQLQGKKQTAKKKIRRYTHQECLHELNRLEKAGHQLSKYYYLVKARAKATA